MFLLIFTDAAMLPFLMLALPRSQGGRSRRARRYTQKYQPASSLSLDWGMGWAMWLRHGGGCVRSVTTRACCLVRRANHTAHPKIEPNTPWHGQTVQPIPPASHTAHTTVGFSDGQCPPPPPPHTPVSSEH